MSIKVRVSFTADQRHSPEAWIADLRAAGWIEVRLNTWQAPDGYLYRGPYGAWVEMHRRRGTDDNDAQ